MKRSCSMRTSGDCCRFSQDLHHHMFLLLSRSTKHKTCMDIRRQVWPRLAYRISPARISNRFIAHLNPLFDLPSSSFREVQTCLVPIFQTSRGWLKVYFVTTKNWTPCLV